MTKSLFAMTAILSLSLSAQAQLFDRIAGDNKASSSDTSTGSVVISAKQASPKAAPLFTFTSGDSLIDYMRNSRELQADFVQISYSSRGQEESRGQMWIAKPGKFYWDYQQPYPQKIISDGQRVYHYDLDLEQITVRAKDELVGDIAIRLLEGEQSIENEFDMVKLSQQEVPAFLTVVAGKSTVYALRPNHKQAEYNEIWVVLLDGQLSQVAIDGGVGMQTIMTFSNLKRNHGIPASKFDFIPPKGVDVIGDVGQ